MIDYLDAAAVQPSYLTGKPWSEKYAQFVPTWKSLPVYQPEPVSQVLEALKNAQMTLLTSGTGSGKTVIVPKIALKHALSEMKDNDKMVVVTTPKTFTTLGNAKHAANCLDVELGQEVGYAYRGQKRIVPGVTKLVYMTDGYLLSSIRNDPMLSKYAVVIVDEAHERQVATDILLLMLRQALMKRADDGFRVVVMSATIDEKQYMSYFESAGVTAKLVQVSGAPNKPVKHVFLDKGKSVRSASIEAIFDESMKVARDILTNAAPESSANMLVFVPTIRDVNRGCEIFFSKVCGKTSRIEGWCDTCDCKELYGRMEREEQDAVLLPPEPPLKWKLIFATNVAESSVTFKDLDYVIDSGVELQVSWLPLQHAAQISKHHTTQAQIQQRSGRVGRTKPGTVYHMYTKNQLQRFKAFPDPTILTVDFTDEFFSMLASGKSMKQVLAQCAQLLTPPSNDQIAAAVHYLTFHKLMDHGHLTRLGKLVHMFNVQLKLSTSNTLWIVCGELVDRMTEAVKLAAIMEETNGGDSSVLTGFVERVMENKQRKREKDISIDSVAALIDPMSDHITILNVYDFLEENRDKLSGGMKSFVAKVRLRVKHVTRQLEHTRKWISDTLENDASARVSRKPGSVLNLVAMARAYHAFDVVKKGVARTGNLPRNVSQLSVQNDFPIKSHKTRGTHRHGTCESLFSINGKFKGKVVTFFTAAVSA